MTSFERIERYLNNQLTLDEVAQLHSDLQRDTELQKTLDSVDMMRRMARTERIRMRVRRMHTEFINEYQQANPIDLPDEAQTVPVIPLGGAAQGGDLRHSPALPGRSSGTSWFVRIAATVLLAVVGYAGYQVGTLNPQTVFEDAYVAYQLPVGRGTTGSQPITDSLFRVGNYAAVIERPATGLSSQEQSRHFFLTGMAYLQLRQYPTAVAQFERLRQANRQGKTYFGPETDYYQALAYIGAGNYEAAYARFRQIHDNPRHLFRSNVSAITLLKLRLLTYK